MKYVWLVGGGPMQMWMLREIQARGLPVLVTDGNPDAPARHHGVPFFCVSTYDVPGHLRLARELNIGVQAVCTVAADVGPTVSALAEYYGVPACSYSAAVRARRKASFREAFSAAHPIWMSIPPEMRPEEAKRAWLSRWEGPFVVKASESRGSRGFSVGSWERFEEAVMRARAASLDGWVVLEEALFGEEVAIDCLIVDGATRVVNTAARRFLRPGLELGHTNPGPWDAELEALAAQAAAAVGVHTGPWKLDLIRDHRYGWCVLEVATRFSGGFDHFVTAVIGPGKDLTGLMLDYALGWPLDWSKAEAKRSWHGAAYAPPLRPGRIAGYRRRNGDATLPPGIIPLRMDFIPPLEEAASRPLFAVARGESAEEAWERAVRLADEVEPIYVG